MESQSGTFIPAPKTIDEVISGLKKLTENENKDKDILREEVTTWLNSYYGDDWHKFEFWDPHTYTRNLIYQDPENRFALILLCWNISQMTPIHNHPNSQCFYKLLKGELIERTYQEPAADGKRKRMQVVDEFRLDKIGGTGYIDDGIGIHMVENALPSEGSVTLHLYTPAYESVRCWDERTGKSELHSATNYSVNGVKCLEN